MTVKPMLRALVLLVALAISGTLSAAERIPPAPAQYFNDYAGVVSPAVVQELNGKLEQFEKDSSNQLLVAIYPKMESDSSVEDYTVRVAQSWRVGQKKKDNGAVLFVFMQEHQVYIQVGYGLEAVLPDATAKRIIENEIVPRFRQNDVDGAMKAAVGAMIAATKGEYKGTGQTHSDSQPQGLSAQWGFVALFVFLILLSSIVQRRNRRGLVIGGSRGGWWIPPSGGGGSSGGWSSGGGGGGFSGGGGSFGGGGAGGKW
ncbi:MAG: TPM domain-containing protein [Lacunisphaera sp.]